MRGVVLASARTLLISHSVAPLVKDGMAGPKPRAQGAGNLLIFSLESTSGILNSWVKADDQVVTGANSGHRSKGSNSLSSRER